MNVCLLLLRHLLGISLVTTARFHRKKPLYLMQIMFPVTKFSHKKKKKCKLFPIPVFAK